MISVYFSDFTLHIFRNITCECFVLGRIVSRESCPWLLKRLLKLSTHDWKSATLLQGAFETHTALIKFHKLWKEYFCSHLCRVSPLAKMLYIAQILHVMCRFSISQTSDWLLRLWVHTKSFKTSLRAYLASSRSNNKDAIASACSSSVISAFMTLRSAIILSNSSATKSVQISSGVGYELAFKSSWMSLCPAPGSVVASFAIFEVFLKWK